MFEQESKVHLKLALMTAVIAGLASAHVDIAYKLIRMNFVWIEFYQVALYSVVILAVPFALIVVFIEILRTVCKQKVRESKLRTIYERYSIALAIFLVLLSIFYAVCENSKLQETFVPKAGNAFLALTVFGNLWLALTRRRGLIERLALICFHTNVRRFFGAYGSFCAMFILSCFAYDVYLLSRHPRLVSGPKAEGKPNVIFISLDTLRADHLPMYGYTRNTSPHLQEIAARSVVFDRVSSSSSWTLPSHSSMFTGKWPSDHGALARSQFLPQAEVTLAEILQSNDYVTAGYTGGTYCKRRFGIAQGFQYYSDRIDFFDWFGAVEAGNLRKLVELVSEPLHDFLFQVDFERSAKETNELAFRWLDDHVDQTFFLFLHYFDVHDPYNRGTPFEPLKTDLAKDSYKLKRALHSLAYDRNYRYQWLNPSAELKADVVSLYDGEIKYLDEQIGTLFDKLRELGLLEKSLIVITADHGEEFFDHGGLMHTYTLFEELLHVPLIVHFPSKFTTKHVSERVGNIDVFATILDTLGLPIPEGVASRSLLPLLDEKPGFESRPIVSEFYGRRREGEISLQAVTEENWKFMRAEKEGPRTPLALFDLESDAGELHNMYGKDHSRQSALTKVLKGQKPLTQEHGSKLSE